jgi:hypothetical protein
MTIKRGVIYGAIIVALSIVLWFMHRRDRSVDQRINTPVLMPGDSEKLILDPAHHSIIDVTRTGPVRRTYLPPHPVSVTIGKDGKVTVTSRAWGTEASPFIGFGYSDKARLALGVDLLYWHRWELGPFLGVTMSGPLSVRVGVKVSFNVWNNTSLYVGVDNTKTPTGGISFKF